MLRRFLRLVVSAFFLTEQRHANQNPSKRAEVRFRKSETAGMLDATVGVQDSRPLNVFLNLNNTGTDETGDLRATLGAQYSNLFNLDLQNTTTYEQWEDEGGREAIGEGRDEARRQLERYAAPAMDSGLDEALLDFVAQRTADLPPDAL